MATDAISVINLPTVNALANTDQVVCVSNAAGANGGNVTLIAISSLFGNSNVFLTQQTDPTHSNSLVVNQGVLFFSNAYGYIAVANNSLMRFAISTF